ncbi:hypothetical protein VTO42DRAFT_6750 [Malbranchea cinnamomea]
MISIQHACFSSILACAAATTLPPSPIESPSRCDTPSACPPDIDLPESPVTPSVSPQNGCSENSESQGKSTEQNSPTSSAADVEVVSASPPTTPRPEKVAGQTTSQHASTGKKKDQPSGKKAETPEPSSVSFVQFAHQFHLERYQKFRKMNLLHRLRALRISLGISNRLLRVASTVQRGLVESFRQGDKSSFVSVYNSLFDMREACDTALRRNIHGHDPLINTSSGSEQVGCSSFVQRLTPRSKQDLLEILTLVRTDSQFLFRCISQLTPSQLSGLVSSVHNLDLHDFGAQRSRTQSFFSRRAPHHSLAFKEHVFALERTDPLSALVINVFTDPLGSDTREARLRLDVWSSTCAKLVAYGGSGHYSFVGHLLSFWAGAREWKAKAKFEIYLMDVLQEGAFLLEQHDLRHLGIEGQVLDPLRTDVAEKFFQSAVLALFGILDDEDGGLPAGALEFGNAILGHLNVLESRNRFLEYIFLHWFFGKFVHTALIYPESLGLLLDFHISKDARDRLLGQISLRAQAQVAHTLRSLPQYSRAHPNIRARVESMLSRLVNPVLASRETSVPELSSGSASNSSSGNPLLLSITDITTILDVLFPRSVTTFGSPQSHQQQSMLSSSTSIFQHIESSSRVFQPSLFQGRVDTLSPGSTTSKTAFTTEISLQDLTCSPTSSSSNSASPVSPQLSLAHNADRIRFEFSEISESDDRPVLDHPVNEDWAIIYVSHDGKSLSYDSVDEVGIGTRDTFYNGFCDHRHCNGSDPLICAILKLVDHVEADFDLPYASPDPLVSPLAKGHEGPYLIDRFADSMEKCRRQYDFVGAHFWWNASRLLKSRYPTLSPAEADREVLAPIVMSLKASTEAHTSTIKYCEKSFVDLKLTIDRFQFLVNDMMSTLQKLRNKMWFMTDVKNSLRYEDARNVALALKKMGVPQTASSATEPKPKLGQRTLGGSFLQKPEIQVLNVMKAPGNQGGPSKLSDEQVEITRKWLEGSGIDNFCKGEERIHRFCYEVKMSVNKLVGETMYDTPVLWSSELFQKERSLYEASGMRSVAGLSLGTSIRPASIASEDSLYYSSQAGGQRGHDQFARPMNDVHSLGRKSSYQSLASDRWRSGRDIGGGDTSSIGDSPGRTISSTADLYQPFWSPPQTQTQSITSASSLHSRPPSTYGEITIPKRPDHKAHGKAAFLEDLKRTVTSLLLSDLGSPVWSCGSETDAWFSAYLNDECIKEHTRKRLRREEIKARLDAEFPPSRLRRSQSVDTILCTGTRESQPAFPPETAAKVEQREESDFGYDAAFRQLMDKFSRPSNPFVKLRALHDIQSLVIASLTARNAAQPQAGYASGELARELGSHQRNSISEGSLYPKPPEGADIFTQSPIAESMSMTTESLPNPGPTEDEIVDALADLIQRLQPKTLFRDLQFIAAFVPSETLNKTDSGSAFVQFGLAAFKLKDNICHSIIEIADGIVSLELNKRHRRPTTSGPAPPVENTLREAAQMWIIPAREGHAVAQRELAILYLTHPELVRCVTLPLTMPRDTFKADMMYRRDGDSKSDPQSMCLALHWMQLAAAGGDPLAQNRLREREEFESLAGWK